MADNATNGTAAFRLNAGWGGARTSEANAIGQDMTAFVTAANAALASLTGRQTVGRFTFAGRSYRAVRVPGGWVQVLSSDRNRLIASNTPEHSGYA